jgi:hypothetical protein
MLSTASPPMRRKQSVLSTLLGKIELMYYQYEVTFSPYVLTRGEKFVLNTIVVVLLTLLFVGMATYLPKLVARAAVGLVSGSMRVRAISLVSIIRRFGMC